MACPFCEPGRYERELIEAYNLFHSRGVHLTGQQTKVMAALLGKNGVVRHDVLAAAVWGDRDEPEDAIGVIRVAVTQCRKKITRAGLSWEIRSTFGMGYALDKHKGKSLKGMAVSLILTICGAMSVPTFFQS